jgi:diaminopropionate ammonia-lyase
MFERAELDDVRRFYSSLREAQPTPLRRLGGLASRLGLAELFVKDESNRFELPAFKILGTRYAVARLLDRGMVGDLACATAGNHGRAVARAARLAGRTAHVYVPRETAPARVSAIRAEGAEVVTADAEYDETVRLMARDAARRGWTIVSDMAWVGYEQVPKWIMAGYTWMLDEAAREWGSSPPDLVVVQAGVGSFAGGVAGWLQATYGTARPRLAVVEPCGSACVAASLRAGRPVDIGRCEPTAMAGLRCAAVSPLAWPVLRETIDATVQISEEDAHRAVDAFAQPVDGDASILAGASGAAGLAGLMRLLRDPELGSARAALGLSRMTRALVFNTEGPTDR